MAPEELAGPGAALYSYALPLSERLRTSHGLLQTRRGLLVCLRDHHGLTGWGEAAPLAGWHGPDLPATRQALTSWLREAATDSVSFEEPNRLAVRADETLQKVPCAWAAVAGAAADLAARQRGLSLAAYLSNQVPEREGELPNAVVTAALLHGETTEALTSNTASAVAAGFGTLKLKVGGRRLVDDVARIAAVREAAPGVALRLDANGAWGNGTTDVTEVREAVEAFAGFAPELLEEPCRGLEALRHLQQYTDLPIAADESLPPLADLPRHLPLGVAVAVLKPSALGNPTAVLQAAAALAETGTAAIIGSFLESAVGLATAAHVAVVAGGLATGLGTAALLQRDVCESLAVRQGALCLPTAPGLGLQPTLTGDLQLLEVFNSVAR